MPLGAMDRNRHFLAQVTRQSVLNRFLTSVRQVPDDLLLAFEPRSDAENILTSIKSLDELSVAFGASATLEECAILDSKLRWFHDQMIWNNVQRSQRDLDNDRETTVIHFIKKCLMYGFLPPVLRLVMTPERENFLTMPNKVSLKIKKMCFSILLNIVTIKTFGQEIVRKEFLSRDDFLPFLYSLLGNRYLCREASQMIEQMLLCRDSVLDLNDIDSFKIILQNMDEPCLANACKVFALTLTDWESSKHKKSLQAENQFKRSREFVPVKDINQEFLLNVPNLIEKLLNIALKKTDYPRFPSAKNELDNWLLFIDDLMSNPDDSEDDDSLLEFDLTNSGGLNELGRSSYLKLRQMNDMIQDRLSAFYTLCLLMNGKHKKRLQKQLGELKLIPNLNELFDVFGWSYPTKRRRVLAGHNSSCECSPEIALKIQFLRLIHMFCDHSEYKRLLLNPEELQEIRKINMCAGKLAVPDETFDQVPTHLMCTGKYGLLVKIVRVLLKEPPTSTFRFWLSRALESYLRGHTSFADQQFLIHKGVLEHIVKILLELEGVGPKELIQSSFDLLAELCKFNISAFARINQYLREVNGMKTFCSLVNRNLVDSNMFIRAAVLTASMDEMVDNSYERYQPEDCIYSYMMDCRQQFNYVYDLINILKVNTVSQETVCCLNTALIFLLTARKRSELGEFLTKLQRHISCHLPTANYRIFMQNFRELLHFWLDNYLHRDKDCTSLVKSTRFELEYWKETVKILLSDDTELKTSLNYYLESDLRFAE